MTMSGEAALSMNAPGPWNGPSEIDSALLSALRDPRERLPLFRLEKTMVEWMNQGQGEWIEVGGPYNSKVWTQDQRSQLPPPANELPRPTSFQRCILHRLADRFGIIREQGSFDTIRLIRLPESKIPPVLLQDLDPSLYSVADDVKGKQKKMKIMKRNSNKTIQKSGHKNQRDIKTNRQSFSDKEKAYAEARARIFQDSESVDLSTSETQIETLSQRMNGLDTNEVPLQRQGSRNSGGSMTSLSSANASSSNLLLKPDSKAVYRNYAEEAADPDFQRSSFPKGARSTKSTGLTASAPAFTPGSWRPSGS